ncbi:unnamed protein product [Protopolystoma xenopodis]|uniref:Uncharacterized protein n=1 Tax=Protopolystoma xenopodis TaxID=117903 RepID=A0A3S5CMB7_9PLAT|nr:unnamed protein product [Protopolystoma xenopodis]
MWRRFGPIELRTAVLPAPANKVVWIADESGSHINELMTVEQAATFAALKACIEPIANIIRSDQPDILHPEFEFMTLLVKYFDS